LLLGKRELIAAAVENNNSIDDVVGRGMKVAKEQIVGMVAAVDWILSQSDEALQAEFRARAQAIADYLHDVPSLKAQIFVPEINQHASTLLLRYDQKKVAIAPRAVADALRKGSPSIELHPATGDPNSMFSSDTETVVVGVWMLQEGEDMIVAKRLHEVLMSAVNA
jgi:L-seryl-tRNA(Ser) seleniumtransferase